MTEKISFFVLFQRIFQTALKAVTYVMYYFVLHHWYKFVQIGPHLGE